MSIYGYDPINETETPLAGLAQVDGTLSSTSENPIQNRAVASVVNDMNNILGAKNLLPNKATTQVVNGVTWTVNSDGTVTANGTATEDSSFVISTITVPKGSYIKTGCPSGGAYDKYVFGGSSGGEMGDGLAINLVQDTELSFVCAIAANYTANNLIFKPMLRPASIADDTYVPYAMTNRELTQSIPPTVSIGVFNTDATTTYTSSLYAGDTHYFADAGTTLPAGNYIFFVFSYYATEVYWQRTVVVPQGGVAAIKLGIRREDNSTGTWPTSYSFYYSSDVPFTICPAYYDAVTTGSASLRVHQYTLSWIKVTP